MVDYALMNQHLYEGKAKEVEQMTKDALAEGRTVQEVLKEAIKLGGSSVSDYVGADGEEGFFQLQHRVYGREGQPCLVCKTPIKRCVERSSG